MKAIITWQQVTLSEVYIEAEDIAKMRLDGVDPEDGMAVADWIRKQPWLIEGLGDNWFEKHAPEIDDVEPQTNEGVLL